MTITSNTKLRAAREARGFTQAYVAQCLEVNPTTYKHWEGGIRPNERNIAKLCRLFGKTREELGFEEAK
jgi:DNA-binding XRE family transcriptional regulator